MKIISWNVNSIRARLQRLLALLDRHRPDVVCLQETKVTDEEFPSRELSAAGYHTLYTGQKAYNGVAILSLKPATDSQYNLADDEEKRFLAAKIDDIYILCIYAPNGRELDSHYYYQKLNWYEKLYNYLQTNFHPTDKLILCGDFNIAPDDRDVWNPQLWQGQLHCSEPERTALRKLFNWGLHDALRLKTDATGIYSWWDYRSGSFYKGHGLRIDLILVTDTLGQQLSKVTIDRNERKGSKPSDHAPVIATFDLRY
ncbi:MAG: exodeoxyribonuclease III [Acidobacteriota bacterium]|nr:exodeoxyribonuclease III [Blastocatellia bacterium]MDW8412997.1 exodeoxyribonuclease III [Acidobacteriota bacterium]